jgi:hypothetical protein
MSGRDRRAEAVETDEWCPTVFGVVETLPKTPIGLTREQISSFQLPGSSFQRHAAGSGKSVINSQDRQEAGSWKPEAILRRRA